MTWGWGWGVGGGGGGGGGGVGGGAPHLPLMFIESRIFIKEAKDKTLITMNVDSLLKTWVISKRLREAEKIYAP